ncbi:MAG: alpha/beta fold hydrolase [Anaerolineales bacterium]|nr:alpha/beta fold hydrolase [Anaerolineales bacterium]
MRVRYWLSVIGLLLLAACAGGNVAEETAVSNDQANLPLSSAESVIVEVAAVVDEVVTIPASDGLALQAVFMRPGGDGPFPAVLLLHMLGSERQAWEQAGVMAALVEAGYAVLALDMRGHGATGGKSDWQLAQDDVQRVWSYLAERPDVAGTETAVVGASIGANLALITAAAHDDVRTAVLLSPGLDYRGVTTEDALAAYGERPLLIVASEKDTYAANSSRTLHEQAAAATLHLYQDAGHGTQMFAAQPDLIPMLLDWLTLYLRE